MGVPLQTAIRWEQDQQYQIPESFGPPATVLLVIHDHFRKARTADWMTRLTRYWAFQEKRKVDEGRHGKYRWIQFSERYRTDPHSNLKPSRAVGESFLELLLRLLDSDPNVPHDAGADMIAYKLRSTVAMHRRTRVGTEFHGFMHLPPEIRNVVYSFSLSKGTVIVPNNAETGEVGHVKYWGSHRGHTYERYQGLERELWALRRGDRERKPLGLIQGVSRTVHAEATRVYFGSNRFILPVGGFSHPSRFTSIDPAIEDNVEEMYRRFLKAFEEGRNNAPLVRDVSYSFDIRDCATNDYMNLCYDDQLRDAIDEDSIAPGEALRRLHDQKTLNLEEAWTERMDAIKWMGLDRLQLDFEECYCGVGCCRKVGWVLDRLLYEGPPPGTADTPDNAYSLVGWKARPPLVIEVSGWKNHKEETLIREKLGKLQEPLGSIDIRLGLHTKPQQPVLDADDNLILRLRMEARAK